MRRRGRQPSADPSLGHEPIAGHPGRARAAARQPYHRALDLAHEDRGPFEGLKGAP